MLCLGLAPPLFSQEEQSRNSQNLKQPTSHTYSTASSCHVIDCRWSHCLADRSHSCAWTETDLRTIVSPETWETRGLTVWATLQQNSLNFAALDNNDKMQTDGKKRNWSHYYPFLKPGNCLANPLESWKNLKGSSWQSSDVCSEGSRLNDCILAARIARFGEMPAQYCLLSETAEAAFLPVRSYFVSMLSYSLNVKTHR